MIAATNRIKTEWRAYGIYTLLLLAIMLPLLRPGFILTLDMVFTPQLRMPDAITSSYLFHAGLHVLNLIIPSDIIEKGILCSIILLCCIGLHQLVRAVQPTQQKRQWGIYVASIFFALNPYTYARFMAGQYSVLLGYALLPWFTRMLFGFVQKPSWKRALWLGGMVSVIATLSIHTLGELAIIALVLPATMLLAAGKRQLPAAISSYVRFGSAAVAVFLVCCGFWLVPLALGQGKTAATIHAFTAADTRAFATTGGSVIGRLGNVIRLQGFWAEGHDLFLLPQDRARLWGLMSIIIIALVVAGATSLHRRKVVAAGWATSFMVCGVIGIALAVGLASTQLAHLGYREPQKFVGLVALSYSVFLAFGVNASLQCFRSKAELLYAVTAVGLCALPLLLTRTMLWGFDGQLTPRHYPGDWKTVNAYLDHDPSQAAHRSLGLMLPWHQYMSFTFAGRIIANPAPDFFNTPVIVSQNPEFGGARGQVSDSRHAAIEQLLQHPDTANFAAQLAANNTKYVLVAKDTDYRHTESMLATHPELHIVQNLPHIIVYKNTVWREK